MPDDDPSEDGVPRKNIALTQDQQKEAYQKARAEVKDDIDAGAVDARQWSGDPTDGEVVRVLAEAYTGTLEFGVE